MSEGRQWIGDGLSGISTNGGGIGVAERVEDRMLTLLKRHEVQTLLAAGHDQIEVAVIAGVSVRSVRRIAAEPAVEHVDDSQERVQRRIGRPSKVEPFRALVQELVEQVDEETHAPLKSVEILRRARLDGYRGGKSALYELIAELRPHATRLMMRFEGLPGEFSQHDFGEVRITYLDGSRQVVRFFCSRLKWSRWAVVDLVPNQVVRRRNDAHSGPPRPLRARGWCLDTPLLRPNNAAQARVSGHAPAPATVEHDLTKSPSWIPCRPSTGGSPSGRRYVGVGQ